MKDKHLCFADIEANYREEKNYRISAVNRDGKILILGPHGGGIERGSSELVSAIAGDNLSFYLFEALMPTATESQKLHITSTRFDEPRCLELIRKSQSCLAIHGCVGIKPMIFVGGRDVDLKSILITGLSQKGYPVQLGTGKYAGCYPSNICNRTITGKGEQLELSNGLRSILFNDWRTRKSRKSTTALFARLTADIRDLLG
jgi:phage replication-related protein YjqB (UPF0714/DUF867 family)